MNLANRTVPEVHSADKPTEVDSTTDPRIYFAAERTLLAWLRTGIAVIGMGFLVARFGLFLAIARDPNAVHPRMTGSTVIGTLFVLLGSLLIFASAWQHNSFSRQLNQEQRPANYWMQFSVLVAMLLGILGLLLGAYLVISLLSALQ